MDGQLSLLPDLDRASDERKPNLCNGWNNAILNEHGVFIENRVDIEVYKTKKLFYPRITIHLALEYPKVYYSFDVCGANSGGGGFPSRNSNNFDVHEHVDNVALMMEHALRPRADKHGITEKMINDCINKFKDAIASDVEPNENGICTRCGFQMLKNEMKNGLCAACYALLNPPKEENEDGWKICPICNEKVDALCKSGLCVECDYKKKHPDAKKKFCEQCIHFNYHNLYDKNDHTECCCKLHLEGKNRHEWSYLCKDFVKCESVEQHEIKRAGLMKYASYKKMEKCAECGKNWRWLYGDICGVCYEKKRKKADEIARGFKAEGWKEVPEKERENATYSLGGWIDERDMDAFEPRVGTRYFLIDVRHLTWRCFFKKEIK